MLQVQPRFYQPTYYQPTYYQPAVYPQQPQIAQKQMPQAQTADDYARLIEQQFKDYSFSDIHAMFYPDLTDEEFNLPDNEQRNELLFKEGKFLQLAKYGTDTNCEQIYNSIKDNADFKDLSGSKYYNNAKGFVKLVNAMDSLTKQRKKELSWLQNDSPYCLASYSAPAHEYQKYDVNDYLKMLNNFAKNKYLSDDLKQYVLSNDVDKLDLYYSKLDKLQNNADDIKVLI